MIEEFWNPVVQKLQHFLKNKLTAKLKNESAKIDLSWEYVHTDLKCIYIYILFYNWKWLKKGQKLAKDTCRG